jgi:hypothetical protein
MQSISEYLRPGYPAVVNEIVVRFVALQVFLTTLALLYFQGVGLMVFLGWEFLIRFLYGARFSLFAHLSKGVLAKPFTPRMAMGTPKRFAQLVGFLFVLAAVVSQLSTGSFEISFYLLSALALFSALEAFFGFCAVCVLFGVLYRFGILDECKECSNLSKSQSI